MPVGKDEVLNNYK